MIYTAVTRLSCFKRKTINSAVESAVEPTNLCTERDKMFLNSCFSCINPVIYGFMSRNFRRSFISALCQCANTDQTSGSNDRTNRSFIKNVYKKFDNPYIISKFNKIIKHIDIDF